ncbi:hypothetical protein B0T24DRAFT_681682 [Lasiosphaeria ovina]|uniref:Uncharacterized protein n=1 Tax=Lasiosphaeria ovina TaxID=92902 RepID=A0AAE0N3S2_9PEZI|nr:hypothetical protein B0T24DRAFT_681682 [Lasiosphaeria ovina]
MSIHGAALPGNAPAVWAELERNRANGSALHATPAPAWVASPEMRGTSDILYSCVLTLFACIYTALHLNIPARRSAGASDAASRLLRDKCVWAFLALVAPETVLYCAWSQFTEARALVRDLRVLEVEAAGAEAGNSATSGSGDGKAVADADCAFDLKYGFFVVMGGLEMWYPDADGLGGESARTLSAGGVRTLARTALAPLRVPGALIADRSKANTLQKLLVLLQVGWMAAQCAARAAYGLPLTLLELHTLIHVACAVGMYVLWFKKPLDLRTAEAIDRAAYGGLDGVDPAQYFSMNRTKLVADFDARWLQRIDAQELCLYIVQRGVLGALMVVLPIIYSGAHLAPAWDPAGDFGFPSAAEALLWKIACIATAAAVPALVVSMYVLDLMFLAEVPTCLAVFSWVHLNYQGRVFVVVFLVCRVYIVVEAFASLRAVPIGAYLTPSWIEMIPHV